MPVSVLPGVTVPVNIDGTSQPGYAGTPLIELHEQLLDGTGEGLDFGAGSDGSAARGLVLNDYGNVGIQLSSNGDLVQGCYIGTSAAARPRTRLALSASRYLPRTTPSAERRSVRAI